MSMGEEWGCHEHGGEPTIYNEPTIPLDVTLSWLFHLWIFLNLVQFKHVQKLFLLFCLHSSFQTRKITLWSRTRAFTVYPASKANSARVFLLSSFFFPFLASSCIFRCILGDHWGPLLLRLIASGNEPFLVSTISRKKKRNYMDVKEIILCLFKTFFYLENANPSLKKM